MNDKTDIITADSVQNVPIELVPGKTANYHTGNATMRFEVTYRDGTAIETVLGPNSVFKLTLGDQMVPEVRMTILSEASIGPRLIV